MSKRMNGSKSRRSSLQGFAMCIELLRKEAQTVDSIAVLLELKDETVRRHLRVLEQFEMVRRVK